MDVDTSYRVDSSPLQNFEIPPKSAAPSTSTFQNLFYETTSPQRFCDESPCVPQAKKRRSHSPDAVHKADHDDLSSSPGISSSPSDHKLQRMSSGPILNAFSKPGLEGLGCPPGNGLKRPRRPILSALIQPSDARSSHSAFPTLSQGDIESPKGLPPARRAFSALIPASATEQFSEESSFEGGEASSPAAQAYAQRRQAKTIRRCDGTEDFRPLTGATALKVHDSPRSHLGAGLPGFGDNESHGKLLPCHRVREDGLMRIKWSTVSLLLENMCFKG
jgi:M-phase inducer tyrosine phosphatase